MFELALAIVIIGALCWVAVRIIDAVLPSGMEETVAARKQQIERNQSGPPVVFLRSFETENIPRFGEFDAAFFGRGIPGLMSQWRSDAGDDLVDALSVIGRPIAIGQPGDTRAHGKTRSGRKGATRTYAGDRQWQKLILHWLPGAALVVAQLGNTPGFLWEVKQVVNHVPPTRILLVLPPFQGEYDKARRLAGPYFPKGLPEKLSRSRLVTFDTDWTPISLQPKDDNLWRTLKPVFDNNGYELPASWAWVRA